MACTPLLIDVGLFLTTSPWEKTASKSFDTNKKVTFTTAGPNPGITIEKGGAPYFYSQLSGHSLLYAVLGNKYLLLLDVEGGATGTRTLSVFNFDTMTPLPLFSVLAPSTIPLPVVNPSQGSGTVFLAYGQNGTDHTSTAIYRSDNGAVLCSVGASFAPTGETRGEATATDLIIHYSTGGTSHTETCPRPSGNSAITPASQSFPDVAIGGCTVTAPSKVYTIRNSGSDCLLVNPISGVAPFSITATSKTLPTSLAPNETMTVTVAFSPTAIGNWNPLAIPVSTTPANGDSALKCVGMAVAAEYKCSFSALSLVFGKLPLNTAQNKMVTITNSGSKPITVSSPGVAADGFTVAAFSVSLTCGQQHAVTVGFSPTSEGAHSATLTVSHSAANSPTSITLTGSGCVANAEIIVPPTAPIDMGAVQRGFRTVRFFTIQNPADGPLNFQATITGPDAALFGLPESSGPVANAPSTRSYAVNPVSPCGNLASGSGEVVVGVSFFANDTPKVASATLTISGHNATNVPAPTTWSFPLSAVITPPIALDVALVVDRSDSMNQALGSRVKIDAAVSSAQLFVELLRPDLEDRVALVRFNNQCNVVLPMTPVSTSSSPTQDAIRQMVDTGIRPAEGLTAIAGGAMLGVREVETPHPGSPSPLNKVVVVLTDGIENTAFEEPAGTWLSLLGGPMYTPNAVTVNDTVNTSPVTWPANVKRFAIGVGAAGTVSPAQLNAFAGDVQNVMYVDQDLTGKLYFQLEKHYTQIFMNVVGTQTVLDPMYWINPGEKHEIQFEVLRGDVDAMVVIFDYQGKRLPFFCVSPQGEIIDPSLVPAGFQLRAAATKQARIVQFKMPLKEPDRYAGTWTVVVRHDGRACGGMPDPKSKSLGYLPRECGDVREAMLYGIAIGVGSDFRMQPFVTPAPVFAGDPILLTAMVSEAGLGVTGCTVTVEATAPDGSTLTLGLRDDGASQDGAALDGEYARAYPNTFVPGIYHFKFRAVGKNRDGQLVMREALRDKPVLERGRPDPGTTHPDGSGRPTEGGAPPAKSECCELVMRELRLHTKLLKSLASQKTKPKPRSKK